MTLNCYNFEFSENFAGFRRQQQLNELKIDLILRISPHHSHLRPHHLSFLLPFTPDLFHPDGLRGS